MTTDEPKEGRLRTEGRILRAEAGEDESATVKEEIGRRENRLAFLLSQKSDLESECRRLSLNSAVRAGDVGKAQVLERFRKSVKYKLEKQISRVRDAEADLMKAVERLKALQEEVEAMNGEGDADAVPSVKRP